MSDFEFKLENNDYIQVWMTEGRVAIDIDDQALSGGTLMTHMEARRLAFALLGLIGDVEVMAKESKQ